MGMAQMTQDSDNMESAKEVTERARHDGGRKKRAMGGSGKESALSPDLKKEWSGGGGVRL